MLLHRIYKSGCESVDHNDPERVYRIIISSDLNDLIDYAGIFVSDNNSKTIYLAYS